MYLIRGQHRGQFLKTIELEIRDHSCDALAQHGMAWALGYQLLRETLEPCDVANLNGAMKAAGDVRARHRVLEGQRLGCGIRLDATDEANAKVALQR